MRYFWESKIDSLGIEYLIILFILFAISNLVSPENRKEIEKKPFKLGKFDPNESSLIHEVESFNQDAMNEPEVVDM